MSALQISDYGVSRRRVSFRLFKLECQDPDCIDPICNHGVYKAVNEKRRNVLDETEMFLPTQDCIYPTNFLRAECLDPSHISERVYILGSLQ